MEDLVRDLISELYPEGQPATVNAMVTIGLVVIAGFSAAITAAVSWAGKKIGFSLWNKVTTPRYRPLFEHILRQVDRPDTYMDLNSVQNEVIHVELSNDLTSIAKVSVQVPGEVVWLTGTFSKKEEKVLLSKTRNLIQNWIVSIKLKNEQRALEALQRAHLKMVFPIPIQQTA